MAGQYLRAMLAVLPVVPYTEQTAYGHARIWAELEPAGKMAGDYDIYPLIAQGKPGVRLPAICRMTGVAGRTGLAKAARFAELRLCGYPDTRRLAPASR
jgi:hypothetical protein